MRSRDAGGVLMWMLALGAFGLVGCRNDGEGEHLGATETEDGSGEMTSHASTEPEPEEPEPEEPGPEEPEEPGEPEPESPPRYEAFFNYPGPHGENDLALEEALKDLLELAEEGSTVHGAFYTWTRTNMSEAFIEAHERGVDVRLIVHGQGPAVQMVTAALPEGHVIHCTRGGEPSGCHGGNINHNKFLLFSGLSDGSTSVVAQSSANLTNPQLRLDNNILVIRDDEALYDGYLQYWTDMSLDVDDLDYYWSQDGDAGTKAWFLPRNSAVSATGENDPVWELFDDIDCSAGSTLHIGHARWSWARRGIAHKAAALQQAGCSIHVVVTPHYTTPELVAILTDAGVSVTLYPHIHSKYWLLDGVFQGQQGRIVWTGSQNFTSTGLRSNDEAFVQIEDPDLYEAYLQNWQIMQGHPDAR